MSPGSSNSGAALSRNLGISSALTAKTSLALKPSSLMDIVAESVCGGGRLTREQVKMRRRFHAHLAGFL